MVKQNLVIYSIPILYNVLKELEEDLNYNLYFASNINDLNKINHLEILILNDKKKLDYQNTLKLNFPIKISKLIEKINIEFIKLKTKVNSNYSIGDYVLNLNSRKLILNSTTINLTEKETNLIKFLDKSNNPASIKKLEAEVWGHGNKLETHTVETHIHRLRKKILDVFNKKDFILSDKKGYYLNKLSKDI